MASACYVYAIVRRETPLPADGAGELAMVAWRELAAVTAHRETDVASSMDAVMHHEAVVEAVRRLGPALPVRFGTVFRDERSVASALAERYEPLAADLDRVGDKVELSVTALWAAPQVDEPPAVAPREDARGSRGAGARYLHERAAALLRVDTLKESARAAARELDQAAGGLALERRLSLVPTPRVAFRAAYLLEASAVGAFRTCVEAVRGTRGALRVLLTGPWPPYSFVSRAGTPGEGARDGAVAELAQHVTDVMRGRAG